MISALKVFTILATALFGIYGSLFDFRNKSGRVSIHGWIGLIGVIICGASAAGLELYSSSQEEEAAQQLQLGIDSAIHPLAGLSVSLALRPDWQKKGFRLYLDHFADLLSRDHQSVADPSLRAMTSFGNYPFLERDRHDHPLLRESVCRLGADLLFYRKPIALSDFRYDISGSGEDLRISISNPCDVVATFESIMKQTGERFDQQQPSNFSWEFDQRDGRLHRLDFCVNDIQIDAKPHQWISNARISSLRDLLGAQLVVQLRIPSLPPSSEVAEYRRSVHLGELLLHLPSGLVIRLDGDNLEPLKGDDGFAAYAFTFPEDIAGLMEATRYDRFKHLHSYPDPL